LLNLTLLMLGLKEGNIVWMLQYKSKHLRNYKIYPKNLMA